MPVSVKDSSDRIAAALRELSRRRVLVGVPAANNARDEGGIGNAALAYIHNYGAPEANVPARPFMEPGIRAARAEIVTALSHAAEAGMQGDAARVDANLDIAGIRAVASIKRTIQEGIPPSLKQATVTARRRRSSGSQYRRRARTAGDVTPLIDTAQMLGSITHVVEKK